jgi:hypothetical protein
MSVEHSNLSAPRCLDCAYTLEGLSAQGCCPECSRFYDLSIPSTYSTKPPFVGWVFWFPGLAMAIGGGMLLTALLAFPMGNWGWPLWFTVPFAAGCILGYRVRVGGFALVLLGLVLVAGLIMGMMTMQLAGVFCGLTLGAITLGPILIGAMLGVGLRSALKQGGFSQRSYLPVLLVLLVPVVCAAVQGRPRGHRPVESISTVGVIAAPVGPCWDSIMFYEEVTHEPPWILKVGLARPLYTTGMSQRVGDIKRCMYNKGPISKLITRVRPGELLAFEVVEQRIGYERDVRLTGGAFAFRAASPERTEVTLTTSYEPLLSPRWVWRPFERVAVHTLHNYVIEGMRLRAEGGAPARVAQRVGEP